jgi:hypothetical protein
MACLDGSWRFSDETLPVSALLADKTRYYRPLASPWLRFLWCDCRAASDIEAEGTQIDNVAHGRHTANA